MKKANIQRGILTAAAIVATLAYGTGCASCHRGGTAPVVGEGYGAPPEMVGTTAPEQATGPETVIPLQKEEVSVGAEQVPQGAIRVRKVVKTETINEPVTLRNETVSVEKVGPGQMPGGQTALNQPFQGGEITIPLVKEQAVITKRVVPAGAVVVRTQDTTTQQNVQAEARHEYAYAEPINGAQNVNISGNLQNEEAAGAPAEGYGQTTGQAQGGPITQWNQLGSPDQCVGRQVNISNAKVDKVISPRLISVQAENGKTYYVHTEQPTNLQPGQTVTIMGTIQQVPSDTQQLGWDPASQQAIQGQQIMISAPSLQAQPQQ